MNLTDQEKSVILNALNYYWNDAHKRLDQGFTFMSDGSRRPIGDIEKIILEKQKEFSYPLIMKFEKEVLGNVYQNNNLIP